MSEIDKFNQSRALKDDAAAIHAGFAPSETFYEIGTGVNALGVENATRSKREFDAMANGVEMCERGIALIQSENRIYKDGVDATQLVMYDDGKIGSVGKPGKALPITERGFERLCSLVTPGGADYLKECSPELRAYNMNKWFPVCRTPKRDNPKELAFWIRDQEDKTGKEIFSSFGSRYVPFGGDMILKIVQELMPAGAKAEMIYDRYRGRLNVLFHSDVKASDYVAGEYFKAGFWLKWADDGTGGIATGSHVLRNLCLNLIMLANQKQRFGSRRHTGDEQSIREDVTAAINKAVNSISYFAEAWNSALSENILDKYDVASPVEIFEGLVYNKVVWMPGVDVRTQVARLCEQFEREPGYSKAAIINAVTRCAHEYSFNSPWVQDSIEETGGELLHAKVWNVYVPDETRAEVFHNAF